MTSTLLGKWRLHLSGSRYVSYTPSAGKENTHRAVCVWRVNAEGGPYPPGKETNIALFLRDSQLCFLFNNGKYAENGIIAFGFADTLANAQGFAFSGHDSRNLPTEFNTKIQSLTEKMFLYETLGIVLCGKIESASDMFTITQVTPPLTIVQAKSNGDGLDLAWLDLSGLKFTSCSLKKTQLNNCIVVGTDFSGANLSGANLNHVNLTGVVANPLPHFYTTPLQPPSPDNPRTTLVGSHLKQSLIGNDWTMLDLTMATITDLSSPLSSQARPLQVKYSILTGFNQNNLSDLSLQYAVFDNAVLDHVNLNGADLTNASFIQASMHGAVLSHATLKNANMTGAQLGSLSNLFTLPAGYETHLSAGPVDAALRDQFAQHGITLSTTASLNTLETGRVWQLNDAGNKVTYSVRFETGSGNKQVLMVYAPALSASLVNAYMPDAVLTGANLYGAIANGVQFYGSKARLDGGAILEKVEFNDANLSNVNFTQAHLYGANLSGAQLFNAKFNKANLSPSADGMATNLSNANLQGADFTDAQLYAAKLVDAAIAINMPTKANPKQGGVYLFSLPYKGDTHTLQQYTDELTAAANKFSLNPKGDDATLQQFLMALKNNNLTPLKIAFAKHQPAIVLSNNAQINVVELKTIWQIVDGPKSYTLWIDPDEAGENELYAAPSLNITQAGFKNRNLTLRWQASASIDTPGQQWLLDNDSENPNNFSTGYVRFIVKLNGNVLDVYGTALRILRLSDRNQQEFDTETFQVTILSQANMNADTVCPNGATLSVNQSRTGKTWDNVWLRAATPPQPPACVPTDFNWCPPPTKKKKE